MFDWLEKEIGTINTRRFHVVEGPADAALRAAIEGNEVPLPRSYKEFVFRFGQAKLYDEGHDVIGGSARMGAGLRRRPDALPCRRRKPNLVTRKGSGA